MTWPFIPDKHYNRRAEIHGRYGGQMQGGIATPAGHPAVFLFTGHGALKIGYGDAEQADGSFRYTGEGQVGDMQMIRGNLAIRDHAVNGRDLLLFEKGISRGPVRYVGQFFCADWEIERQPDINGDLRDAIVFTLVPKERIAAEAGSEPDAAQTSTALLLDLRIQAIAAASPGTKKGEATKNVYQRSAIVRRYVLSRAAGACESCDTAAPFKNKAGEPFLEPHHIRRVSDGGPDDPRHMAGICPNCHREAHYGAAAEQLNTSLAAKITAKEKAIGANQRGAATS